MDKDTKVLLMAVVIILVALVSFNLSDLTGKTVSSASVTVETAKLGNVVEFGKYDSMKLVTVKVLLGDKRVNDKMYLHSCDSRINLGIRMGATYAMDLCDASTCGQSNLKDSYSYKVYSTLNDGKYCFAAKHDGEVVTSNRFTVKHV